MREITREELEKVRNYFYSRYNNSTYYLEDAIMKGVSNACKNYDESRGKFENYLYENIRAYTTSEISSNLKRYNTLKTSNKHAVMSNFISNVYLYNVEENIKSFEVDSNSEVISSSTNKQTISKCDYVEEKKREGIFILDKIKDPINKKLFRLKVLEGYSFKELVKELNMKYDNVVYRYYKIIDFLKNKLTKECYA